MTLTLDVSRSNFEIAVSRELLVWLIWNEKAVSWYDSGPTVWHCPLTRPMTLTLEFQGQNLKQLYLRNGVADWHGTKRMWVIHSCMILTSVAMVGWADVLDIDRDDFFWNWIDPTLHPMAWRWTGDKSLPKPMVTRICRYMVSPGLSKLKYLLRLQIKGDSQV